MSAIAVDQPGPPPRGMRGHLAVRFVGGLARSVVIDPVRHGTLRLRGHSPAVIGIAVFVTAAYVVLLAATIAARPLRAASDFVADTSRGDVSVLPEFLVPALLFLLGLAFALVLAGSLRAHPAVRVLMLLVVVSVVGSFVMATPDRALAGAISWIAPGCLAATAVYSIVMWWVRTPASADFLVLFVLLEATIVTSYRATVVGQASSDLRFDIATTALLLTYLTLLASPIAFAAGLSAVGVGVAAASWSADFVRREARTWVVTVLVVVLVGWQAWVAAQNTREALSDDPVAWLRHLTGAVVLSGLAWFTWRSLASGRRSSSEQDPVGIVEDAGRFGLPVGYALQGPVIVVALLTMILVGLAVLAPDSSPTALQDLVDALSSPDAVTVTRWAVVIGLAVAATVLSRRGHRVLAAIAAVNALVMASLALTVDGALLTGWFWTPDGIGDVGLVVAVVMAVGSAVRRRWTADRVGLILVVIVMAALVRQAAILEVPMGFLLSASTAGLLVFGLAWSFLNGGSAVHADGRHSPRDRRLLLFLGESVYALAIVAWAVIGKKTESAGTLSDMTALAVLTLGTSLVLVTVLQQLDRGAMEPSPAPSSVAKQ